MKIAENAKNWLSKDNNSLKLATLALIGIGMGLVYTLGSYASSHIGQPADFFFCKSLLYGLVGIALLAVGNVLSKKWVVRISAVWLIIGLMMMICTLVAPEYVRGSARYVSLFGVWIDPFSLTMPAYIVMMSHWLSKERARTSRRLGVSFWITLLSLVIIFLALLAPYILMAGIYLLVFVVMALKARKTIPELSILSVVVALANVAIFVFASLRLQHVWSRLCHFGGYTDVLSLKTISSCSMLGNSPDLMGFLADNLSPITDFAFVSVIFRYGLIAGILLVGLYYIMGRQLAQNTKTTDRFYGLLNVGVLTLLGIHLLINLANCFGLVATASYLPLVSYAPIRLIAFCALLGFIFSERER